MSVYAGEQSSYFRECLQSIYEQTVSVEEVVLVLDGPVGLELKECIEAYRDVLPIKLIELQKNCGLAAALNIGLGFCSEELIIRVDSDDLNYPNRFKLQYDFMIKNAEICVSSGQIDEFMCDPNEITSKRIVPLCHEDLVEFAKRRSPMNHPAVVFRRSKVEEVQGYPDMYPEDYFLWWKIILSGGQIANISETLVKMRTNKNFYRRRGLRFFRGEMKLLYFLRQKRILSYFEFSSLLFVRFVLRAVPPYFRELIYRAHR